MKSENEPQFQSKEYLSLYEKVTNKIVALIENGVCPWKQPWSTYGLARNYISGRPYTGINYLLLNNAGYVIPYFLTFDQIKALGGSIKNGTRAEIAVYFRFLYKDCKDQTISQEEAIRRKQKGEEIHILRFIKYYNVFNVSVVEVVELDLDKFIEGKLTDKEKIARCKEM